MKIIRVLVYEGEEQLLKSELQRRGVKKMSPAGWAQGRITITEAFDQQDAVDEWLGEKPSAKDMQTALTVADAVSA